MSTNIRTDNGSQRTDLQQIRAKLEKVIKKVDENKAKKNIFKGGTLDSFIKEGKEAPPNAKTFFRFYIGR